VLDLYAGTGALGIEALSRGAASALFADSDARALRLVEENLRALDLTSRARTLRAQLPAALDRKDSLFGSEPFDIILADPPYRSHLARETVARLLGPPWFPGWRCLVVETERDADLADMASDAVVADRRVYGDSAVVFFRPAAPER
jgi:16S rRNA (guanine(966)-N(2))-methyltransferase RsmD